MMLIVLAVIAVRIWIVHRIRIRGELIESLNN